MCIAYSGDYKGSERLLVILKREAAFNDEELRAADSIINEFLSDKKTLDEWKQACHTLGCKIKEELTELRTRKIGYLSVIVHQK